jgi:sec-independent protein translocase protein TatA
MLKISLVFHERISFTARLSRSENAELNMDIGPTELIIILIIVILLFGVGRISKIAGELGSGIRAFRDGLQGSDGEKETPEAAEETKTSEPSDSNEPEMGTETPKDS